jgi:ketosteroid isomerase-like protein
MGEGDLRTLKAAYTHWAEGNFSGGFEIFDAEVVYEPIPDRRTMHGPQDVARYMSEFLAQWSGYRITALEFTKAGASIVVRELHHGKGKSSGVTLDQAFYSVWTFRDGRVVRASWFGDREAAIAAAAER